MHKQPLQCYTESPPGVGNDGTRANVLILAVSLERLELEPSGITAARQHPRGSEVASQQPWEPSLDGESSGLPQHQTRQTRGAISNSHAWSKRPFHRFAGQESALRSDHWLTDCWRAQERSNERESKRVGPTPVFWTFTRASRALQAASRERSQARQINFRGICRLGRWSRSERESNVISSQN